MIPRQFIPPNFRATVQVPGGEESKRLEHGTSREEVRTRLEKADYLVKSVDDYDFSVWRDAAKAETAAAVAAHAAGRSYEFDDKIWAELKEYLFRLFEGKCAYCEGPSGPQDAGAVEHYRPKSRVAGSGHPGYYWLAYDYLNYLPACSRCNSKKGSRFPLIDEAKRANGPADPIAGEQPQLISPYEGAGVWKELDWDFVFAPGSWNAKFVTARPVSLRAEKTIEIVGLNRPLLPEARAEEQNAALHAYQIQAAVPHPVIAELRAGSRKYSAACLASILKMLQAELQQAMTAVASAEGGGG